MSAIKKGVKKIGKFIKKHWKKIVIAVAVVFTAGLATVGMAAFSGASGLGGFLTAAGQTLVAGGQAILGTVGIGSGVTVGTGAGGALASFKGATLLNGTLAQTIGVATKGGAAGVGSSVGTYTGPGSSFMGANGSLFGGSADAAAAASAGTAGTAGAAGTAGTAGTAGASGTAGAAQAGASAAGSGAASSAGGGLMRQALISAVQGGISAYAQGRAAEQQAKEEKPKQLWGVDLATGQNHYQSLIEEQQKPQSLAKPVIGNSRPKVGGLAAVKASKKKSGSYRLRTDEDLNAIA